ncbi:sugar 3,4-ketoisomerase [Crassaminicella indica]|uniref:FdtA/QdtA family cupin domain-containing protein n=1 Tax=Crassaminicella indica TaxID=2855394 RepID=A0ABX8RA85_9CLOT|nr:FdtA/QdtA family cupin domain-containing protein [Crassaminicella indica]QXM05963.1 FdtA/QdtA family cupin domain-containing protein [Crassaminicella indica]
MYNSTLIKFKNIHDKYGNLVPIEENIDIPFPIKRLYYIWGVKKDIVRGHHAHRKLHQILICIKGSIQVRIKTPLEEQIISLNTQSEGLYIGPMIWREMFNFSEDAVLLVLASDYYNANDYIRDYNSYLDEAKHYFKKEVN